MFPVTRSKKILKIFYFRIFVRAIGFFEGKERYFKIFFKKIVFKFPVICIIENFAARALRACVQTIFRNWTELKCTWSALIYPFSKTENPSVH